MGMDKRMNVKDLLQHLDDGFGPLTGGDIEHLSLEEKEELAEALLTDVENLPTIESDEAAMIADEIDENQTVQRREEQQRQEEESFDTRQEKNLKRQENCD